MQTEHYTDFEVKLYNDLLSNYNIIKVSNDPCTPEVLKRRNRKMVDEGDEVLAIWNGSKKSGTYSTIHYAKKKEKKVTILNPSTLEITEY